MRLTHSSGPIRRCVVGILTVTAVAAAAAPEVSAAKKLRTRAITRPTFDPSAERVDLFEGMKSGRLEARVIARDSLGGAFQVTNLTSEPLTVELPEAFVAVQVNRQILGAQGGLTGGGGFGGRGTQTTGGGVGGVGGAAGGAAGGQGQGFFSVPPERTVSLPYHSVCLEHGKKEPNSRVRYTVMPVDAFSADPVLYELLTVVARGRVDTQTAQAAAWHVASDMSWTELLRKVRRTRGRSVPYFDPQRVRQAELLVATARGRVREKAADLPENDSSESTDGIPLRSRVVR